MHRSSESFAALAAALAKAQAHLVNPEKSHIAAIAGRRPGEAPRSFRYAPPPTASRSSARRSALAVILQHGQKSADARLRPTAKAASHA